MMSTMAKIAASIGMRGREYVIILMAVAAEMAMASVKL
jgi:hypothetical protein